MKVVLPKGSGSHEDLAPGEWLRVVGDLAGAGYSAVLRCPECKRLESLGRKHAVAGDGTVTPSVVCPHDCTWHVFVRLEGWGVD